LGHDDLTAFPLGALSAVLPALADIAEEAHRVDYVGALNLPRVAVLEPVVGHFNLLAVLDDLLEDTIVVADTISPCWNLKRG
jgi:hypothetical protein